MEKNVKLLTELQKMKNLMNYMDGKKVILVESNQHKIGDTVDIKLQNVLPNVPIGKHRDELVYNAVIKQIEINPKTNKNMVGFENNDDIYWVPIEDVY